MAWLETVHRELEQLAIDKHVFWEVQDVVRANPRFAEAPGLLTQWMASCFIASSVVAIRRQIKADGDSISLRRILREILQYPQLVSRTHYRSHFVTAEEWLRENGEREFDRIAGADGALIRPDVVEGHIAELAAATGAIEHCADCRIAHYDHRGLSQPTPRFADLDQSLASLERVFRFYWLYLKGSSLLAEVLPTIQVDWKAIFQFAWAPRPAERQA